MPTSEFNAAYGYTEHICDVCGERVPWSTTNIFGECQECAKEIEGDENDHNTL